jgi:hypothetical protein
MHWTMVEWQSAVDLEDLSALSKSKAHLYAVVKARPDGVVHVGRTPEYIGQAFGQSVEKRIQQDHSSWGKLVRRNRRAADEQWFVRVGQVVHSSRRPSLGVVTDVEALLIYRNQPDANVTYKKEYDRTCELVVVNRGDRQPLTEVAFCHDECRDRLMTQLRSRGLRNEFALAHCDQCGRVESPLLRYCGGCGKPFKLSLDD